MNNSGKSLAGDLMLLARHVHIVHHIPGRIRLRLLPSAAGAAGRMDLDGLVKGVPGIINARFKMIVGTVVIEYDRNRIPPELWELLVRRNGDRGADSEIEARLNALFKI